MIVHLALCGSHAGKRTLSHDLILVLHYHRRVVHSISFWYGIFFVYFFPIFPFSFFLSFILLFSLKPVFLTVFFARKMFLFLSLPMTQQLLSLRLHSVSCLLCPSPIFFIISRFSATSGTGLL